MQPDEYIRQDEMSGYYCCEVIVLLNALVYHDVPGVRSCRGAPWQELVNLANCRQSPYEVKVETVANHLGLDLIPVPSDLESIAGNLPVRIPVTNGYGYDHACLVIDVEGDILTMANYEGIKSTEAVNTRPWSTIQKLLGESTCQSIQLIS